MVWSFVFLNKHKYTSVICSMHICSCVFVTFPHAALVLLLQVVPLSQRSGVLEWCSGTTPIGEFLVNVEEGAHKRYRPKDYSGYECQKIMMVSQRNWKKK